jgi:glutamyl-tRNA reductase
MRYLVVGCSFRTSPLALRERLAFAASDLPASLEGLKSLPEIEECLLLSTCNRVEIYAVTRKPRHAVRDIQRFLERSRGVSLAELEPALYDHEDREALRHIFRVAASLDALVVGEAQIGGQVKEAYSVATRVHTVGPLLSRCIHRAFAAAKRIRHETEIARHPVSVSSVAADLAARIFGDLEQRTVLVIGAGEMAELAVRHLLSDGAVDIRVTNRTYERAVGLAFQLGAKAVPFEELRGQLLLADIVIASTGSPLPIIGRKLITEVMRERKQRPLFLIDIAVPRDVEREAGSLANVYLFDLDDLERVVEENLKERRKEARQAERIIDGELDRFSDWLRRQDAVPVIKKLREHFLSVAQSEAAHTAQALQLQNGEKRQAIEVMAHAIVNKLLHQPIMELKKDVDRPGGSFLSRATCQLFHLQGSEEAEPKDDIEGSSEEET